MKAWKGLATLAVVAGVGYWWVCVPANEQPSGEQSLQWSRPGPHAVITESFRVTDPTRPTAANQDDPGSPSRTLEGELWRPKHLDQPGPLLVYSHGFMSTHREGVLLTRYFASHGYTVVAVDYPLTNFSAPGGPLIDDAVHQPDDVRFVIDTLLKRNEDHADVLYHTIDAERIAAAGVSLGGLTTHLSAFHPTLRDPRIKAAVSIAGITAMFPATYFAGSPVPLLAIHGDIDTLVTYTHNGAPMPDKAPNSLLLTLYKGSHAGFAEPAATLLRFASNPDRIGCVALLKGLKNRATPDWNFLSALSDSPADIARQLDDKPCAQPIEQTAMPAARQQLLERIASYAFLQSVLADTAEQRSAARHYLLDVMPQENAAELQLKAGTAFIAATP